MADRPYLDSLLKQGREKAAAVANLTLTRVKDALGYSRPL
jgi:tryptophanyl-tRNA synthetase